MMGLVWLALPLALSALLARAAYCARAATLDTLGTPALAALPPTI
jgi:hypothetical protein